jgi:hypothetical protein
MPSDVNGYRRRRGGGGGASTIGLVVLAISTCIFGGAFWHARSQTSTLRNDLGHAKTALTHAEVMPGLIGRMHAEHMYLLLRDAWHRLENAFASAPLRLPPCPPCDSNLHARTHASISPCLQSHPLRGAPRTCTSQEQLSHERSLYSHLEYGGSSSASLDGKQ